MCLILFAHKVHPAYPLVLAANRDEAYSRPTAAAGFWKEHPHIYGGRDLDQGGTWLGITRNGRVAAVTNFRNGDAPKDSTRSRGALTGNYLRGTTPPAQYVTRVQREGASYNGFSLIVGDLEDLHYVSNRAPHPLALVPGIYGLSNHLLNSPWPKVQQGSKAMDGLLQLAVPEMVEGLFAVLADRTPAPDKMLPDTGIGLTRERALSAPFIVSPTYGTRASTVLLVDNHGQVQFSERSFGERGKSLQTVTGRFTLETAVNAA